VSVPRIRHLARQEAEKKSSEGKVPIGPPPASLSRECTARGEGSFATPATSTGAAGTAILEKHRGWLRRDAGLGVRAAAATVRDAPGTRRPAVRGMPQSR